MKSRSLISVWIVIMAINVTCVGTVLPVTNTPFSTPKILQATPVPDLSNYGGIKIKGDAEFTTQTRAALILLEQKYPDAFKKVQTYIGMIEQGEHSGMWVWENPPRYEVGEATAFFSVTWYASTITHDATHSELYTQYQAAHPNQPVPERMPTAAWRSNASALAINWRYPSGSTRRKAK